MLLAAGRRFLALLGATALVTTVVSLLLGLATGAAVDRAVSVGFYLVGSFLLAAGFFVGNRGPVRLRSERGVPFFGSRLMRWATPREREETISDSAIFVSLGLALLLLGVAVDSRYGLL